MAVTFSAHGLGAPLMLAVATLWPVTAGAAGDAQAGREKARSCAACHGIDGAAKLPHVPNIGGESPIYLEKQLKAFRSGARKDPNMDIVAQGLSDEDIADLVAWYASIEFTVTLPE
jgi:cytochrome c553